MYRCERCHKLSQPNEHLEVVTVEIRPKVYFLAPGKESHGHEVVHEAKLCIECSKSHVSVLPPPKVKEQKAWQPEGHTPWGENLK